MADTIYTVKRGDTLSEIADNYKALLGVDTWKGALSIILRNNPEITDPDFIVVGQKIWITGGLTYTVQKGDTLTSIATKYAKQLGIKANKASSDGVDKLMKLNPSITNPNKIYVDQKITIIQITPAGKEVKANTSTTPTMKFIGQQANSQDVIYTTWTCDADHVKSFDVCWEYYAGKVWFTGLVDNVPATAPYKKQSTYTPPSNATQVRAKVIPYSYTGGADDPENERGKTVTKKVKDPNNPKKKIDQITYVAWWTGKWCKPIVFNLSAKVPDVPPAPTVTIDKYTITARLDNLDVNASKIQFAIVADDKDFIAISYESITKNSATFMYTLNSDNADKKDGNKVVTTFDNRQYKVRCRSYRDGCSSDWSEYSSSVTTIPAPPVWVDATLDKKPVEAKSKTSVCLSWVSVKSAKTYEIQYATNEKYLGGSDAVQSVSGIETTTYTKTGLETGNTYFFRVRAVNDKGNSEWTETQSITLGVKPSAPTTWSSTTTVTQGGQLIFYWVHNSKDNSRETHATIQMFDGNIDSPDDGHWQYTKNLDNNTSEDSEIQNRSYVVNTTDKNSEFYIGNKGKIKWRVQTTGISNEPSDWSVIRTVNIYDEVDFNVSLMIAAGMVTTPSDVSYTVTSDADYVVESFPFKVQAEASSTTQAPIGYYLEILSDSDYETVDETGNVKIVVKGDTVYSKYFDEKGILSVILSAGDVDLYPNAGYLVRCTVSMDSGLSAEASTRFYVGFADQEYSPNATVWIDDNYVAHIKPYLMDTYGDAVPDILLSVYRKESDGTFKEIISGIQNLVEGTYANLEETQITFTQNAPLDVEMTHLVDDQEYVVYWNNESYECTSRSVLNSDGTSFIYIGNEVIDDTGVFDNGTNTEEPFLIMSMLDKTGTYIKRAATFQNKGHSTEVVTVKIVANVRVNNVWVIDPHPTLDYARYRIVATDATTGSITCEDLPGYPVDCSSVIIQWNESWSTYSDYHDDGSEITDLSTDESWTGSMLELPYNIDVSERNSLDTELVEYIGREHPVSYYGTQLGTSATWNMVIDKEDTETLYALRRLARWQGDVYVREPSGTGYWANVSVSMSQKHRELTIPVSLTVTRVEGGV